MSAPDRTRRIPIIILSAVDSDPEVFQRKAETAPIPVVINNRIRGKSIWLGPDAVPSFTQSVISKRRENTNNH